MNSIENLLPLLYTYKPISLAEMDSVALMDRFDTKFVFNYNQVEIILKNLIEKYKVLVVAGLPYATYKNLYYDTPDHEFYYEHHNGKGHRCKVRFREYAESKLSFFEIKVKNNKGKTLKSRVRTPEVFQALNPELKTMAGLAFPEVDAAKLQPELWNNFNRITLVNLESKERVTLDFNLRFIKNGADKTLNNLVIAEVKHESSGRLSPFISLMLDLRIKEFSFSKYCVGTLFMNKNIRYNNFKAQLLTINKMTSSYA